MARVVDSVVTASSPASLSSEMPASSLIVTPVQNGQSQENLTSVQNLALAQSSTSVESLAAAESRAVVESVAAIQSQASINKIASAQSVASVQSVLSAERAASASVASVAALPLPTPNLAILIIRNDYCDDTSCGSTGYIYDVVPSDPSVSACSNLPYVGSFQYPDDDAQNFEIDSGKFTSHGVYTNCEYEGSNDFIGVFSCDQVDGVVCNLPTEPSSSCTDSYSLDEDDWVPIAYCEVSATLYSQSVPASRPRYRF